MGLRLEAYNFYFSFAVLISTVGCSPVLVLIEISMTAWLLPSVRLS